MIQYKSFTVKLKGGRKMNKESQLYTRARQAQRNLYAESGKNWDIFYIAKLIEEWEEMQRLFRGGKI